MIKKALSRIFYKVLPSRLFYNSFSQAGEDRIIDFLFRTIGLTNPTYLDLGTNLPDRQNNTFMFYRYGCTGTLVEADPSLIPLIKKKRPRDKVLNVGVNVGSETEADFYIFNDKAINTFSKEEAEYREEFGTQQVVEVVKVQLKSINEIIKSNFQTFPDFISMDIEGLDLEVLKTLDFESYPVPVICTETCTYTENHIKPKDNRIADFLLSKGYFIYADTYVNTIFVNSNWFNK